MTPEELYKAVGMDRQGRKNRMQRLGNAIVLEWGAQARKHGDMGTAITPYVQAISIRRITKDSVTVELPGRKKTGKAAMMARMYEFGLGPSGIGSEGQFDVRRWLLTRQSSTARNQIEHGANGPYRNVPFRRTTAQIRQLGGTSALEDAKALGRTKVVAGPGGRASWNGPSLARGYTSIVNNVNTNLPHRTDRLHGLRRLAARGGKSSRYLNFRRASWAGQPWMHRGIKARRIGDRVRREIPRLWRMVS